MSNFQHINLMRWLLCLLCTRPTRWVGSLVGNREKHQQSVINPHWTKRNISTVMYNNYHRLVFDQHKCLKYALNKHEDCAFQLWHHSFLCIVSQCYVQFDCNTAIKGQCTRTNIDRYISPRVWCRRVEYDLQRYTKLKIKVLLFT
jgi:hypothetical protein